MPDTIVIDEATKTIVLETGAGSGGGTPTGSAAGDLTGAYPNPLIAASLRGQITGSAQKSANLSDLQSASVARTNLGLGSAAVSNVGAHLSTLSLSLDPRLHQQRQDTARRMGAAGGASVKHKLNRRVIVGDSHSYGGGSFANATSCWQRICNSNNHGHALPDCNVAVMPNGDTSANQLAFASLAHGTAGTRGLSTRHSGVGPGSTVTPNATSWVLDTGGGVISDTRTYRRARIWYYQIGSGGTFQYSQDGGSTWSSNVNVAGTDGQLFSVLTADTSAAAAATIALKQTGGSTGIEIALIEYFNTDNTQGDTFVHLGEGGTSPDDWLANRGFEAFLAALVTLSQPASEVHVYVGGNAFLVENAATITQPIADLSTLIDRIQAASPLSTVVLYGDFYVSAWGILTNSLSYSTWANKVDPTTGWLAAVEALAIEKGCVYLDLDEPFGKMGTGNDTLGLTADQVHLGDYTSSSSGRDGAAMLADVIDEHLSRRHTAPSLTELSGLYANVALTNAVPIATLNWPCTTIEVGDGHAAHGGASMGATTLFGQQFSFFGVFGNGTDSTAVAGMQSLAGVGSWNLGPGGTGPSAGFDFTVARTGTGAASLTGTLTFVSSPLVPDATTGQQAIAYHQIAAVGLSGSASDLSTGTLPSGRFGPLTGDVTTSGYVATIPGGTVTYAKMQATSANNRIIGYNGGGSGGTLLELSASQVWAMLSGGAGQTIGMNNQVISNLGSASQASHAVRYDQTPLGGGLSGGMPTQAADTVLANATNASAAPTAVAMAASTVLARRATGDIVALSYTNLAADLGLTAFATLATGTANQVVLGSGALSSLGVLALADGTASHGSVTVSTSAFGVGMAILANTGDTQTAISVLKDGVHFGIGGSTAQSATLLISGAAGSELLTFALGGGGIKIGSATTQKVGFFNTSPVAQQSTTGTTTGFTTGTGTTVHDDSTFTGGSGSTAYRISDVVKALKAYGLLAA